MNPGAPLVARFAHILDVSVYDLFTGLPPSKHRRIEGLPLWFTIDEPTVAALHQLQTPEAQAMATRAIRLSVRAAQEVEQARLADPDFARDRRDALPVDAGPLPGWTRSR